VRIWLIAQPARAAIGDTESITELSPPGSGIAYTVRGPAEHRRDQPRAGVPAGSTNPEEIVESSN
jgi:hypothetical protein